MSSAALEAKLAAYFLDKGQPAGEPLEEDAAPLRALLKELAAQPAMPAGARALCERLILEQLPWAEGQLTTAEVERLQGFLSELCEPATMSPEKDTAILRAIHVAAPEPPQSWFSWDLSRFLAPSLSLCAGLALMFMTIGPSAELAAPWLEIERFRGGGYPIGQPVEIRWGTPSGGYYHLYDIDARNSVQVLVSNRALTPGQKLTQRVVVAGPPGTETLLAACTSGPLAEFTPEGATTAHELRRRLTELARSRAVRISFKELQVEVVR